jgi:hypothetical protein
VRIGAARIVAAGVGLWLVQGCGRELREVHLAGGPPANVAELWQAPVDLARRNLLHGPGGAALAPQSAAFVFVAEDTTGFSPGFDVRDQAGTAWNVKLGPEAQTEVVTSRILWAIGYHQPPTYYVREWTLRGGPGGTQAEARFRPDLPGRTVVGDWSWYENPFVGTRPYRGLIVANLILNSWDWKTSNNKIYRLSTPVRGVTRWYVVRDLGASLGKTTYPTLLKWFRLRGFGQGTRNDLEGFEEQGFIERVHGSRIVFDYRGIYQDVTATVTPADVRWTSALLARLSDRQWNDAFRAGGYGPDETARYIRKIKAKVAQGLAVTDTPSVRR